jgi:Flp pilus assembly protein TadD
MAENRPQEAIPFFQTTIRYLPQDATGYTYLASAYIKMGQSEKAVEQIRKALKAEPSNPLALKLIIIYYIQTGNRTQAENYLRRAILSPRIPEEVIRIMQTTFNEKFK